MSQSANNSKEAECFAKLRDACRKNDPKAAMSDLIVWLGCGNELLDRAGATVFVTGFVGLGDDRPYDWGIGPAVRFTF